MIPQRTLNARFNESLSVSKLFNLLSYADGQKSRFFTQISNLCLKCERAKFYKYETGENAIITNNELTKL